MRVISLFSGAGLGDLGWEWAGHEIVAQVEFDHYCYAILKQHWPHVPKLWDIRTVRGSDLPPADLVAVGFPCQPFSVAGRRRGASDDRNLWPEVFRIIREIKTPWLVVENVPGVIPYIETVVLPDLESAGYETLPLSIPACAFGTPHERQRIWIIAHATREREGTVPARSRPKRSRKAHPDRCGQVVADADSKRPKSRRLRGRHEAKFPKAHHHRDPYGHTAGQGLPDWAGGTVGQPYPLTQFARSGGREIEHDFFGVVHGVSDRVDRIKALGNAQVPQVVQWLAEQIGQVDEAMRRYAY